MPIRIKPDYNFELCILNLKSIEEITTILCKDFPEAKFSAAEGFWEVYDEPRESFLKYIYGRDNLTSFTATATGIIEGHIIELKLIFDKNQAKVIFTAQPEHEIWIEHFIMDLKKQIIPLTFMQKFVAFFFTGRIDIDISSAKWELKPRCKIILKQKPSNPMIGNIMANLLSNIIWLVLGMFVLYTLQWGYHTFGIHLSI